MSEHPHISLRIGLFAFALVIMFFAIFLETATSATNEYRFWMSLGLILTVVADSILYWVAAHGRAGWKIIAGLVAVPCSLFVVYDWLARGPAVFLK